MQSGWGRNYNYYCISPNLKNNRSSVASRGSTKGILPPGTWAENPLRKINSLAMK